MPGCSRRARICRSAWNLGISPPDSQRKQFERDPLFERAIGARRQIDFAHAAAADHLAHQPRAQTCTLGSGRRRYERVGGMRYGVKDSRGVVRVQQGFEFGAQVRIITARPLHKPLACRSRHCQSCGEKALQTAPSVLVHGMIPQMHVARTDCEPDRSPWGATAIAIAAGTPRQRKGADAHWTGDEPSVNLNDCGQNVTVNFAVGPRSYHPGARNGAHGSLTSLSEPQEADFSPSRFPPAPRAPPGPRGILFAIASARRGSRSLRHLVAERAKNAKATDGARSAARSAMLLAEVCRFRCAATGRSGIAVAAGKPDRSPDAIP